MGTINPKLLIASRFADLINHVIMTLTSDGKYQSYCGSHFDLPDGTWKDIIESDSIQSARLCQKCLERMQILKVRIPSDSIPQWRMSPSL